MVSEKTKHAEVTSKRFTMKGKYYIQVNTQGKSRRFRWSSITKNNASNFDVKLRQIFTVHDANPGFRRGARTISEKTGISYEKSQNMLREHIIQKAVMKYAKDTAGFNRLIDEGLY